MPGQTNNRVRRVGVLTGGGDVPGLNAAIKALVYRSESLGKTDGCHAFSRLFQSRLQQRKLFAEIEFGFRRITKDCVRHVVVSADRRARVWTCEERF